MAWRQREDWASDRLDGRCGRESRKAEQVVGQHRLFAEAQPAPRGSGTSGIPLPDDPPGLPAFLFLKGQDRAPPGGVQVKCSPSVVGAVGGFTALLIWDSSPTPFVCGCQWEWGVSGEAVGWGEGGGGWQGARSVKLTPVVCKFCIQG